MIFECCRYTDMLYIRLADGTSTESEEIAPGVVLDLDEHHRVIGVEIEHASKFIDLSRLELRALPIVNLVLLKESRWHVRRLPQIQTRWTRTEGPRHVREPPGGGRGGWLSGRARTDGDAQARRAPDRR